MCVRANVVGDLTLVYAGSHVNVITTPPCHMLEQMLVRLCQRPRPPCEGRHTLANRQIQSMNAVWIRRRKPYATSKLVQLTASALQQSHDGEHHCAALLTLDQLPVPQPLSSSYPNRRTSTRMITRSIRTTVLLPCLLRLDNCRLRRFFVKLGAFLAAHGINHTFFGDHRYCLNAWNWAYWSDGRESNNGYNSIGRGRNQPGTGRVA